MSRGLGSVQREIKRILDAAWNHKEFGALQFAHIRAVFIINSGGDPETDKLTQHFERSLKRSLKSLVDRGDVIVHGDGGQRDPFRYATVNAITGESDTVNAKQEWEEMSRCASEYLARNQH